MSTPELALLDDRAVLHLSGTETVDFLQRLVTNDVAQAGPGRAVHTALLTPQGKYLFDFFLVGDGAGGLYLDAPAAQKDDLVKRLTLYKLRADVTIADLEESHAVAWTADEWRDDWPVPDLSADAQAFVDPRLPALGSRVIAPRAALSAVGAAARPGAYDAHRLSLGVPELSVDAERERTLSLEGDLDLLNGVDFSKGCFVGQELTARMKYRGKVRKRLIPLAVDGGAPEADTPVLTAAGKEAGKVRSSGDGIAVALVRLEDLDKGPLSIAGAPARPLAPDWLAVHGQSPDGQSPDGQSPDGQSAGAGADA
ncbi:hypothetical protein CCR85_07510 [Rhodothalassium salexigens]|uniref:CAF17-like 4Fe-4S cluster assembly/insertion protein YgfZ n=1 Tax=Rhodothalassium salexigens TaxID=1086 RepID=UPI0019143719|nr:folate-binding protein YgfZ [Rhodothalassium salexigens]MBK5911339.1 hypothetical protein [Rhodothalassium salexigens]MBK5921902.1 hypothetical protein [Rhodothalassium salexigens]